MSDIIRVFGRNDSTNVQKVLWLLDELDLPFERYDRGGIFGGLDDPHYRAANPPARIPLVEDGNLRLWESNAILRHYARTRRDAGLFPEDVGEAARADAVIDWTAGSLYREFQPPYWQVFAEDVAKDDPAVVTALDAVTPHLDVMELLLEGRTYVAGERFGIADIPLGITMHRWHAMGRDLGGRPASAAWYDRVSQRPAFGRHIFVDRLKV